MDKKEKKTTKPMIYDVKSETERIKIQLEKLSQETPGIASKGGKKEVVFAVKSEIENMMKLGYTAQQIAEAISYDNFKILPKTITEIVNKSNKLKKTTKKTKETIAQTKTTNDSKSKTEQAKDGENNNNNTTEETPHDNKKANHETRENMDTSTQNTPKQPKTPKLPDWMPKGKWNGIIYKGKGIYVDEEQFPLTTEQEKELRALFPQK